MCRPFVASWLVLLFGVAAGASPTLLDLRADFADRALGAWRHKDNAKIEIGVLKHVLPKAERAELDAQLRILADFQVKDYVLFDRNILLLHNPVDQPALVDLTVAGTKRNALVYEDSSGDPSHRGRPLAAADERLRLPPQRHLVVVAHPAP